MTMTREQIIMCWTTEELSSVKTLIIGRRAQVFFEGTSAWAGEFANSEDSFDRLLHAVFQHLGGKVRPDKAGNWRVRLSTRQVEAILYYADVMQDASDPANTGASATEDPDGYADFVAAKRLKAQIAKKWPEATL
jgi:hypothetical protein